MTRLLIPLSRFIPKCFSIHLEEREKKKRNTTLWNWTLVFQKDIDRPFDGFIYLFYFYQIVFGWFHFNNGNLSKNELIFFSTFIKKRIFFLFLFFVSSMNYYLKINWQFIHQAKKINNLKKEEALFYLCKMEHLWLFIPVFHGKLIRII